MSTRHVQIQRETGETRIDLKLDLDGSGSYGIETGSGFLDHMLQLFSYHSRIDLEIAARGDLHVDDHHLIEDVGIALGQALREALGDRAGIERYGSILMPMDEVLVAVSVDLGGRFYFSSDYCAVREKVGDLSTELIPHFFSSVADAGRLNLHVRFLEAGVNEHHRIEAMFKGFARALRQAIQRDPSLAGEVPSTKGVL